MLILGAGSDISIFVYLDFCTELSTLPSSQFRAKTTHFGARPPRFVGRTAGTPDKSERAVTQNGKFWHQKRELGKAPEVIVIALKAKTLDR